MSDLRKAAEDILETLDKPFSASRTIFQAKEALRQALAQQDSDCERCKGVGCVACDSRQILAQSEQEPVAWVTFNAYGEEDDVWYENPEGKLLDGWTYKPLYTAPPKNEWQGLTDEEIKEIVGPWGDTPIKGYTRKLFDQIEAKLKEKNT